MYNYVKNKRVVDEMELSPNRALHYGNPTRHAEKYCANYRLIRTSLSTFKTNRTSCAIKDNFAKVNVRDCEIHSAMVVVEYSLSLLTLIV